MSEKDLSEINIIYNMNGENNIKIFCSTSVKNKRNKYKMIIDNKVYEIAEEFNIKSNNNNKLEIKLKEIDTLVNSYIFYR